MPTAARQKYLAKQEAKKADILSDADRQAEYDKVMSQLSQISSPEVDKFEALMSEWAKDAKVRQGVIPIPQIRRALCYSLGISRSKTFVSLRSDELEQPANVEQKVSNTPSQPTLVDDENDEIPELVSTTTNLDSPSTTSIPDVAPTARQETFSNPVSITQQTQKPKKKKTQTFNQSAPRGSRHASRPPPTMKPKAQSA
jgi:hypothetical protein